MLPIMHVTLPESQPSKVRPTTRMARLGPFALCAQLAIGLHDDAAPANLGHACQGGGISTTDESWENGRMVTNPSSQPALRRARGFYECKAEHCLCGGTIQNGDVHVSVPRAIPKRGDKGQPLTHRQHKHFSDRYHVVCFFDPHGTDGRILGKKYRVDELGGFEKYGREAQRLLDEYKKSQTTKWCRAHERSRMPEVRVGLFSDSTPSRAGLVPKKA